MTEKQVQELFRKKLQAAPAPKPDDVVKRQSVAAIASVSKRDVLKENKPELSDAEKKLTYQTKKFKNEIKKKT